METFDMGGAHEVGVSGANRPCATCGMLLTLPGYRRDGRFYCCAGCARSGADAGRLFTPEHHRVHTARAIHLEAELDRVAAFLADIELLPLYEQKLDRLHVTACGTDGKTACASADGRFAFMTYHIELHFDALQEGGYKSTLCSKGPIAGLRGTFEPTASDRGGTVVTHTETYEFLAGAVGHAMGQFARPYIGWSMERELRTLKRLVEQPNALAEALRIGDPRKIPVDASAVVWDPTSDRPGRRGLFPRVPLPETIMVLGALGVGALGGLAIGRSRRRRRG